MDDEIQQLDKFCERFEVAWDEEKPRDFPIRFLQANSVRGVSDSRLFAEVCVIDQQRRWQAWSTLDLSGDSVSVARELYSKLPRTTDYQLQAREGNVVLDKFAVRELMSCEFNCRLVYGDLPCPDEAGVGLELVQLSDIVRPTATIWVADKSVFRRSVWGNVKAGRQAKGEPHFPSLHHCEDYNKLICAEGEDSSISRNQFLASCISLRHLILTNSSTNRGFYVYEGVNRTSVSPGTSVLLRWPFVIQLGATKIKFSRSTKVLA